VKINLKSLKHSSTFLGVVITLVSCTNSNSTTESEQKSSIIKVSSSELMSSSTQGDVSSERLSSSFLISSSVNLSSIMQSSIVNLSSSLQSSSSALYSSSTIQISSSIQLSSSANTGILVDDRDGKNYKTAQIGTQVWMAENLNYLPSGKDLNGAWCFDNKTSNCNIYGRLYDWATTMNGSISSATVPSGIQGICPAGWHIPSKSEFTILTNYIGGLAISGTKLKGISFGGNDDYKFSIIGGGVRSGAGSFDYSTSSAYLWSTTESTSSSAYNLNFERDQSSAFILTYS
jgi:uncharacterized protein (TIGR02145 family)